MDKARLKKRQLKQSASNGGGDNVRGSNCLGKLNSSNQDSEMGGDSQGEEEGVHRRPSSRSKACTKKFKLHSKSFIDRDAVDHAKVPRKLRSAMNKRTRESLSPPLSYMKKHHHTSVGMEAPRNNGTKKFKQNSKQGGEADQVVSGPITKDEEEVAETLFSLARMLPDDKSGESRADQRTSNEKSSPLQDTKDSPQLASQALKEENALSQLTCSAADHTNLSSNSNVEGASKQNFLSGLTIMGPPIGYGNNKFDLGLGSSTALADLLRTSLQSKGANAVAIPLADPSELGVSPEFCHLTGSMQLAQHEVSLRQQKLDYGLWPVPKIMEKEKPQQSISGHKGSGALLPCIEGASYLGPGKYRMQSRDGEVHGISRRSPSTKLPAWLDSVTPSAATGSTVTTVLTEKVLPVVVNQRQSWKRCAAHVHISRLIQAYQTAERKPRWPVSPAQLKSDERPKLGSTATNDLRTGLNGVISVDGTNALNGVILAGSTNLSSLGKTPNELQIGNLQEKLQRDQQMSISSSGSHSSEKKNCDFLSLSAGGGGSGLEPVATSSSDSYQGGLGLVSSAQGHVAYLHPLVQHHPLMSFSLPHIRSASPQSQLPQYVGSPFYYPAHSGHGGLTKQQLEQQQQFWASQRASISGTHLPWWQNRTHDSQLSFSSSPSELLGTKASQQQQHFALSSLSSIGKREHHPLTSSYVEGGGGLQSDASPRLQLVCSAEHM